VFVPLRLTGVAGAGGGAHTDEENLFTQVWLKGWEQASTERIASFHARTFSNVGDANLPAH